METDFMSPVDDAAAKALRLLDSGLPDEKWTSHLRSAWSRFLLAQMLRTPEDVETLKALVKQEWSKSIPELQAAYETCKPAGAPASIDEFLSILSPENEDAFAFRIGRVLMDNAGVGQLLNNMHWGTINLPLDCEPLFTSDRPIWMTPTLAEPHAFLTMPIGPRCLFIATMQSETMRILKSRAPADLSSASSQLVVEHAVKFVYAIDGERLEFVQKYMSSKRHSSLMDRLRAMHVARHAAHD